MHNFGDEWMNEVSLEKNFCQVMHLKKMSPFFFTFRHEIIIVLKYHGNITSDEKKMVLSLLGITVLHQLSYLLYAYTQKLVLHYPQSLTFAIVCRCFENKNNNYCETKMPFVYIKK